MSLADQATELAHDLHAIAAQVEALALQLRNDAWKPVQHEDGTDIERVAFDGQPLLVGERVIVHASDRYGETLAVVRGAGPDLGDGKQRVHVALENGQNDTYTPSVARVSHAPADAVTVVAAPEPDEADES